jgi:pyruvate-ferredoxin/flavodoxin oxidoreductase
MFDVDRPLMLGIVENQDSYAQGVAAQRPFFFDHVAPLADRSMAEYAALTGRRYRRASGYRTEDAEVVIVGQGSVVANAEAVADWLRAERGLRVGVVDLTMFRPFPSDLVTRLLAGKRAAVVLERVDQPLAADAPLLRELRAACGQAVENGRASDPLSSPPHPGLPALAPAEVPDFYSGCFGLGSRDLQPGDLVAAVENALPGGRGRRQFYLGIAFPAVEPGPSPGPERERLLAAYPGLADLALPRAATSSLLPEGALAVRIHSVGGWGAISTGKSLAHAVFELLGLHVKANPRYGSEKKGQPTTFHAVFAPCAGCARRARGCGASTDSASHATRRPAPACAIACRAPPSSAPSSASAACSSSTGSTPRASSPRWSASSRRSSGAIPSWWRPTCGSSAAVSRR